jgi:hypothetical protein
MRNNCCILLAFLLALSSGATNAREFHDMRFADKVVIPGTQQALQLNGIGYRSKFFFKIYIGALYTVTRAKTPEAVLSQTGPKRLLMHFVYSEVSREKLVNAWNEGFEENTPAGDLAKLRERIDQFNAMFPTLHSGDEVLFDYIPDEGTVVTIKGETKGVIKGEDFNHALLNIWLGNEPADSGLKDALLGDD